MLSTIRIDQQYIHLCSTNTWTWRTHTQSFLTVFGNVIIGTMVCNTVNNRISCAIQFLTLHSPECPLFLHHCPSVPSPHLNHHILRYFTYSFSGITSVSAHGSFLAVVFRGPYKAGDRTWVGLMQGKHCTCCIIVSAPV